MKYLYSWLKQLYPGIPSLDSIEEILINLGHDSEGVFPITYDGISVAEILGVQKHPNADSLALVDVKTGDGEVRVVCGAPNLQSGQKVAYASIGTTLPAGFTIQQAKIRGEASQGMLCAADELGISDDHASLLALPEDAHIGDPVFHYIEPDAIISLDITPNRGDVLSHFGLARDLAALDEAETLQPHFLKPNFEGKTSEFLGIDSLHDDVDAFSLARVTTTSEKIHAPLVMQSRLTLLGQRPINLATDITNYILMEYGQPLHAYDSKKLSDSPHFGVRRAHNDEKLVGLNSATYSLTPDSLVITNNDTAVALAGILGGDTTKVEAGSQDVIFESAHFNPRQIAQISRSLGVLTESAQRFSRGVDPGIRTQALMYAQALWQKYAQGTVYEPIETINHPSATHAKIHISASQASQFIGTIIEEQKITSILTALGCETEQEGSSIGVSAPSWRFDLSLVEDYYEEVVRLVGLQNLNKTPLTSGVPQWKRSKFWRQEAVKDMLVQVGGNEISTYPFIKATELAHLSISPDPVELVVPAIAEKPLLRPTLIPGSLQAIANNPEIPLIILFEVAHTYFPDKEPEMLCISVSGNNQVEIDNWWKNLFERLRLPVASWMERLTIIPDSVRHDYKIRKLFVTALELPLDEILNLKQFETPQVVIPNLDSIHYAPLAKHQSSRRDIAFVIEKTHSIDAITQAMMKFHPFIIAVELFDTYTDSKLGENNYSLAFHIFYQSPDKTLTNEEVQSIHIELENYMKEQYHATIR